MRVIRFLLVSMPGLVLMCAVSACSDSQLASDAGTDASAVVPPFIGEPCVAPEDCLMDGGVALVYTACLAGPGGYCAVMGCVYPGFPCPGASHCFPSGGGPPGFCLNPCVEPTDCRPGFECAGSVTGFRACRAIIGDGGVDAGTDGG
jgi:hypothetical protein